MRTSRLLLTLFTVCAIIFQSSATNVTLADGSSVSSSTNPFAGMVAGDTLFIHGSFVMNANYTRYQNTAIVLVIDGQNARIHWTGNYDLRLGSGSSMLFYNGGDLTYTGSCNNNKTI